MYACMSAKTNMFILAFQIHRAFIDDTNDASDGVYVIEWTSLSTQWNLQGSLFFNFSISHCFSYSSNL